MWEPKEVSKKSVAQNLLARCDLATATFSAQKTLLGPLRIALQDLELVDEAKVLGLAFSRLCRKHKETASMEHPDTSFALAPAKLMESAQLEWGKILYAGGARHDALHHMRQLAPRSARARLLGARWATEASLLLPRSAEAEFREARDRLEDEAAFFYHASYLDYLLKGQISDAAGSHSKRARMESSPFDRKNLVVFTFRGYLQALQRGTKRLHFILNRLLQLAWECCEVDFYKTEMAQEFSSQARKLPPWMWYSVLSQLISRALQPDLQAIFLDIIKDVVKAYPQQSGWHLMQLLKSSDKLNHYDLGQKIVYQCGKEKRELHPLLSKRCAIAEDLIALAGCPGDSVQLGKSFPRLAGQSSFSNDKWMVLVPVTSQMTATIPRMDGPSQIKQGTNFFPAEILSEKCFEHVEVFRSKERPKKLTFLGVDGRSYPFLCKAEKRGDLRKDSRLMEFATMVNQLLAKSPDANRRNLAVRTFQVVILSEKCGLIEWVPNTKGLRNVIDELWKSRKTPRQGLNEIKDLFDRSKDLDRKPLPFWW
ncbi:unnamed protein product [Effrenium voratum]|nr:unnamed protein product [Effrenium voratum]